MKLSPGQRIVLDLLREGAMTTSQFLQRGAGNRFGARINELRDLGFEIDTEKLKSGAVYRLVCDVERAVGTPAMCAPTSRDALPQAAGCSLSAPDAPSVGQSATDGVADRPPLFETPMSELDRPKFLDYDEEAA